MVTIGGGISAMNLAHMVTHEKKMDDVVEHVIYEANEVLGGTWWVNKYPGVAW
jgi:cation diffusion facilitator CzcD-associated flavoprotein CzcO